MERNGYSVEEIGRRREGEQSVVVELASRDWEVQRQLQVEKIETRGGLYRLIRQR